MQTAACSSSFNLKKKKEKEKKKNEGFLREMEEDRVNGRLEGWVWKLILSEPTQLRSEAVNMEIEVMDMADGATLQETVVERSKLPMPRGVGPNSN